MRAAHRHGERHSSKRRRYLAHPPHPYGISYRSIIPKKAEATPKPGSRSGLAEQVDIYPPLCDLAGTPKPKHLQGRSLKPMLDDPAAKGRQVPISTMIATDTKQNGHSRRTDAFRYIAGDEGEELPYDLRTDPDELHNLADKPAQAERVIRMRIRLAAHLKAVNAP